MFVKLYDTPSRTLREVDVATLPNELCSAIEGDMDDATHVKYDGLVTDSMLW